MLELGGKNALIAFPDADPAAVADAMIAGMNFAWCGQSCGSTSRAFVHAAIHDRVLQEVRARIGAFQPGRPEDWNTTMGAIINRAQYDRVLAYIASARQEGATLVCGGAPPNAAHLAGGLYIEPTVFADVRPDMTIAREEIFGPVLSVLKWRDEAAMTPRCQRGRLVSVSPVRSGPTISMRRCASAHAAQAGYVWVNEVSRHFLGAPFGGVKQSGLGREECLEELLSFTQEKNIHVRFAHVAPT